MKRFIILTAALIAVAAFFSSCKKSSSDDWNFDYSKDVLCGGTWNGKAIYSEETGSWIDITSSSMSKFQFSIKFNTDYTYYATGYFGKGSGTYEVSDKSIFTYVNDTPYYTYTVKSMDGTNAELTMTSNRGAQLDIRVARK